MLDSIVYDPQAQTFDAEVQRIVDADPDAVVVIGFDETARLLGTMIEQGVGPDVKAVYGSDGNMSATLAAQVNPDNPAVLQGMRGTSPLPAENEAFFTRLDAFQPGLADRTYAAESYDAVVITALAAAIAGTDEPSAVAEQIVGVTSGGEKCSDYAGCLALVGAGTDIDYDGASGPGEFTEAGEPGAGNYGILEIQADGATQTTDNVEASF